VIYIKLCVNVRGIIVRVSWSCSIRSRARKTKRGGHETCLLLDIDSELIHLEFIWLATSPWDLKDWKRSAERYLYGSAWDDRMMNCCSSSNASVIDLASSRTHIRSDERPEISIELHIEFSATRFLAKKSRSTFINIHQYKNPKHLNRNIGKESTKFQLPETAGNATPKPAK
jgi:hypothetical protein